MVDVNGVHKAACCTPAVDGSYVTTDTPEVLCALRLIVLTCSSSISSSAAVVFADFA
jgi:hypothetical protein